jgi:hypothetical protein
MDIPLANIIPILPRASAFHAAIPERSGNSIIGWVISIQGTRRTPVHPDWLSLKGHPGHLLEAVLFQTVHRELLPGTLAYIAS